MKKRVWVIVAVLALGAAWTGTAWYTGKQAEIRLAQQVERINADVAPLAEKLGLTAAVETMSFERGVFTSRARYGLNVTKRAEAGKPAKDSRLEFVAQIEHGPFPWSRLSAGDPAPALAATRIQVEQTPDSDAWFAAAKGVTPMHAEIVARYGGNVSGNMEMAPVEYTKDGTTLSFSGLTGQASRQAGGKGLVFSVASDRATFSEPHPKGDRSLSMQALAIAYDTSVSADGIEKAITKVGIKHWDVVSDKSVFGLKDIALAIDTSGDATKTDGNLSLDLGGISIRDKHAAKARLVAGMRNVDMNSLRAFREFYEEREKEKAAGVERERGLGSELVGMSHVVKFLSAKPEFSLSSLELETASGVSTLQFDVKLDSPMFWNRSLAGILKELIQKLNVRLAISPDNIADFLAADLQVEGVSDAEAQTEARRRVQDMRDQMVQRGWGKIEQGKFVVNLAYSDGQADFNGERLPVEELFTKLVLGVK